MSPCRLGWGPANCALRSRQDGPWMAPAYMCWCRVHCRTGLHQEPVTSPDANLGASPEPVPPQLRDVQRHQRAEQQVGRLFALPRGMLLLQRNLTLQHILTATGISLLHASSWLSNPLGYPELPQPGFVSVRPLHHARHSTASASFVSLIEPPPAHLQRCVLALELARQHRRVVGLRDEGRGGVFLDAAARPQP
jgi:hypothetical protein